MNYNLKIIVFILILGAITSGLITGVDLLTKDRIAENELAEIKSTVLDAYGISYNFNNIHEVFDDRVETLSIQYEDETYVFYVDRVTSRVSFEFLGNGLWGPISGIISLDRDFETIIQVKVLVQQETPGLGGIVAENSFLSQFPGVKMTPELIISRNADPNLENEVDAITGATGTSNAFGRLLNQNYARFRAAWESR